MKDKLCQLLNVVILIGTYLLLELTSIEKKMAQLLSREVYPFT